MSPTTLPLLLYLLGLVDAGSILAVAPFPSHSHQVAFKPLWEALSRRGHDVTVVTTEPIGDPSLVNLTEIDVGPSLREIVDDVHRNLDGLSPLRVTDMFQEYMTRISVKTLEHPQVLEMIANKTSFDVVLVESLFYELLALGWHFGAPTVLLSSFDAQSVVNAAIGNPRHPIAHPDYVLPFYGELTFVERVASVLAHLYVDYVRAVKFFPRKRREMTRFFGEDLPGVDELLDQVELTFLNVNPTIDDARPFAPATIAFGDGVHMKQPRELPKDIKEFLDGSDEGFVYFSLGTNVRWYADGYKQKVRTYLEVFDRLPYRVLMKYDGDELEWTPKNVMRLKWVPQQDVLRHPKARCFVMQGGHQSMEEAIYTKVPMVVLPMFVDQHQNAKRIQHHGIGRTVWHTHRLDREEILEAILDVSRNSTYKEKIERLARLALDQPMTGIERVTWWTEYLIRNGNADHLRNRAVDLPWYQYLLLDVVAFLLLVTLAIVASLAMTVKAIYRCLRPKKDAKKKKEE